MLAHKATGIPLSELLGMTQADVRHWVDAALEAKKLLEKD